MTVRKPRSRIFEWHRLLNLSIECGAPGHWDSRSARFFVSKPYRYETGMDARQVACPSSRLEERRSRLETHGRIEQYPAKPALRLELLEWVAGALPAGQRMTECELGDRLALVADDVVTLRRYLVDAETLVRTPDGAVYEVRQR